MTRAVCALNNQRVKEEIRRENGEYLELNANGTECQRKHVQHLKMADAVMQTEPKGPMTKPSQSVFRPS